MNEIRILNANTQHGEYITSVSVDDIREGRCKTRKTKIMFLISVYWSDGRTGEIIMKCYKDFFDLQCSILDEFPVEGGQYNKQRTIPYLPGRKIFRKDDLRLAQERKPDIDSYVKELVKLDPIISQSRLVLDFFKKGLECDEYIGTDEQLDNICKENSIAKTAKNDTKHEGFNEILCYVNTSYKTDIDENIHV